MKIEKITYQKTYSIGPYLTDRVGFEATPSEPWLEENGKLHLDTTDEILSNLEKIADEWHRKAHPHLYQEPTELKTSWQEEIPYGAAPLGVIDLSIEKMEIAIDNCMCEDELKQWKEKNPVVPHPILVHYNKRLNEVKP